MSRVPFFSKSWREGRIWDSWMLVHFLSGTTIGFSNVFLDLPVVLLFSISAFGMILWEIIEVFGGVHEVAENRLLDVAIGLIGVCIAAVLVVPRVSVYEAQALFYTSTMLLAVFCYFGWSAYRKRVGA